MPLPFSNTPERSSLPSPRPLSLPSSPTRSIPQRKTKRARTSYRQTRSCSVQNRKSAAPLPSSTTIPPPLHRPPIASLTVSPVPLSSNEHHIDSRGTNPSNVNLSTVPSDEETKSDAVLHNVSHSIARSLTSVICCSTLMNQVVWLREFGVQDEQTLVTLLEKRLFEQLSHSDHDENDAMKNDTDTNGSTSDDCEGHDEYFL